MNTSNIYETVNSWYTSNKVYYTVPKYVSIDKEKHTTLCVAILKLLQDPQNDELIKEIVAMAEEGIAWM